MKYYAAGNLLDALHQRSRTHNVWRGRSAVKERVCP